MPADQDNKIPWSYLIQQIDDQVFIPLISHKISLDSLFQDHDTVVEEWAKEIGYPLTDYRNFAHVAQFLCVKWGDPKKAKIDYLDFLKRKLSNTPKDRQMVDRRTFSQVTRDLGCLDFKKKPTNPLFLLAQLPLPIYLTTSHDCFMELALEAVGKQPQSRVYCWSDRFRLDPPRKLIPFFEDIDPVEEKPLVYHILGIDTVPESLVLSEDDFFELLGHITEDLARHDPNKRWDIPLEIRTRLPKSSLVMLGYSFYDWAFRVAFRGVIRTLHQMERHIERPDSLLIQFQPGVEVSSENKEKVHEYLRQYVSSYKFDIRWDDAESFTQQLWQAWGAPGVSKEVIIPDRPPLAEPEQQPTQPTIFISYSPEDELEKEALLDQLGILQRAGLINLWSHDMIGPGVDRETEIEKAIDRARVAILLISANFLNSDSILTKEMPALLKRRDLEGLIIFPVIAKRCAWFEVEWLKKMTVRPRGQSPVWREGGRYADEELTAIVAEIKEVIET